MVGLSLFIRLPGITEGGRDASEFLLSCVFFLFFFGFVLFSSLPQLLQIYMEPILLSQMLTFATIQVTDNIHKLIKRDVFEERVR